MSRAPLLSVVIPTKNRCELLYKTLSRFQGSAGGLSQHYRQEIEIVVGDNWSTDETPQVAKSFSQRDSLYRYAKHPIAQSTAEESMATAIKAARGTFVWVFGDDDVPDQDSLAVVLEMIRTNKAFYLLNMFLLLPDGSVNNYLCRNDVCDNYSEGRNLWSDVGFVTATTTLSSLCFRRECFSDKIFQTFRAVSQIYCHSVSMFTMFYDLPVGVVHKPVFTYRQNSHAQEEDRISAYCVSQGRPLEYPFSVGLYYLLKKAALVTGEKLSKLLRSKEVEVRKDTWEKANTTTRDFILRFLRARYEYLRKSGVTRLTSTDFKMACCRLALARMSGRWL